ncbi:hypothetical protein GQ55_4G338500 [Panicum hallii var. hallii]|uniref:KIB1-4 beta-propeller domain-containing protein n=1 Tax=Panicum hallii var. hallii TaxID=1504633 RepID=A0A2T7E2Z1_9POAL|nr:hypothetical protein GQ55_4G338500 [Panicum hallii var. hallii]
MAIQCSAAVPAPSVPWLTLPDGTFLSITDGEIIRMPVQEDARCYGSVDNWLFLMQTDGGCSLVNPFTRATVELPNLVTVWYHDPSDATSGLNPILYKTVVLSPLDSSPDSLVAVLILDDGHCSTVCICQPPIATDVSSARATWPLQVFDDVTFFNGKLHGLASCDKLFVFDIDSELSDPPKISSIKCIIGYGVGRYLKHHRTVAFDVFEAGLSTNSHRWRKVNNLGGQVLFVGRHCSKSFPAVEYNRIQGDCIYFMCDYYPTLDPLRDSGMYNMRTGMITPLLSETVAVPQRHGGKWCPTWIFPVDSM